MRAEYILSTHQKAEIDDINKQILRLQNRKAEIYAIAPIRYITETQEEIEQIQKILESGIIGKDEILKFIESEV